MTKEKTNKIDEFKKWFISGVIRQLGKYEEGETWGSREQFARELYNDSNIQYGLQVLKQKLAQQEDKFKKGTI
jgi:hypothetical protein